jgi:hypothetical protein
VADTSSFARFGSLTFTEKNGSCYSVQVNLQHQLLQVLVRDLFALKCTYAFWHQIISRPWWTSQAVQMGQLKNV